MSGTRGKSPGWAAFTLKQQEKQPFQPEIEQDPFVPITTSSLGSLPPRGNHNRNNEFLSRSFSSTLQSSIDFPTLPDARSSQKQFHTTVSCKTNDDKPFTIGSNAMARKKLKEVHSWADQGLIEDIMVAVDNDINKASILLEGMVSTRISEQGEAREEASVPPEEHADPSANTIQGNYADGNLNLDGSKDVCDYPGNHNWSSTTRARFGLGDLESLPPEPEWEEDDDIYAQHRKEAIRMMRSESQHSRAAKNAFLRGDHISAKQQSAKARDEWMAAEKLNAQAAMEILHIRNDENDMWRLDLHGLHATEATQALREHLQKIESQLSINHSISPTRNNRAFRKKDVIVRSSSFESLTSKDTASSDQSHAPRQRSSLQVITGVGNHSRGQASLPAAVRSFLNENGYHFDETRPGVITVRPKFRRR